MKRLLTSLLLLLVAIAAPAQKKSELKAEILSYTSRFTMDSPVSAIHKVCKEVLVNSEEGLRAASFMSVDDDFHSLASFTAEVIPLAGGKGYKDKMSAVQHFAEGGQVDKSVYNIWSPIAPYPFKVRIEYTEVFRKGVPAFSAFVPLEESDVALKSAEFVVSVPAGQEIQWYASAEPSVEAKGKLQVYSWSFKDVPVVVDEAFMPEFKDLVPYVFASPVDFAYLGTKGSQRSWKDLGRWKTTLLPEMDVPQSVRDEAIRATEGSDDLQKLKYVYGWLREHTHYVSIQLGIGGYSPMKPSAVAANGYGDCKALSYFAKSLLDALGVHSEYFTLSTRNSDMYPGYASLGQMNHAMLCVPLQKDTVWVECTNPALPLGYRHDSVAGHEVLLVKGDDSELIRVPSYADSLDRSVSVSVLKVADDGSASVDCRQTEYLSGAEEFLNVRNWERKKQLSTLTRGFRSNLENFKLNGVEDNFNGYDGLPGYVPEITMRYTLSARKYAKINGDRMFVPVPVFSRGLEIRRGERHYPLNVRSSFRFEDEVRMDIPLGWSVEALPADLSLDNEFFRISCSSSLDGNTLVVKVVSSIKKGTYPKDAYASFKELAKSFNKVYESSVVLIRG